MPRRTSPRRSGRPVPARERLPSRHQCRPHLRGLQHLPGERQRAEVARHPVGRGRPQLQHAPVPLGAHLSHGARHHRTDVLGRGVDPHQHAQAVGPHRGAARDEVQRVGSVVVPEGPVGGGRGHHPVEPEGAPVGAVHVVRRDVPPAAGVHDPDRLHLALDPGAADGGVVDARRRTPSASLGEDEEHVGVDRVESGTGEPHGGLVDLAHPGPQSRGQDLLQLGERGHPGLLEARSRPRSRGAQRQHDGDGLVVVEEQRRQCLAAQPAVAPRGSGLGLHRVTEVAQAGDVAAHRPRGHLEPLGELGTRPHGPRREQRQQAQQPGGRGHAPSSRRFGSIADRFCPHLVVPSGS